MKILQTTSRTLFALLLVVGPVVADENPFAQSETQVSAQTKSTADTTLTDNGATSSVPEKQPSSTNDATEPLFFAPRAVAAEPAVNSTKTTPGVSRGQSSLREKMSRQQTPPRTNNTGISAAIFETNSDEPSAVRQVSGQGDNPFFDAQFGEFYPDNAEENATANEIATPYAAPEPVFDDATQTDMPADAPVSVVPNTDGDSLPSEHTGPQQPSVEVQWTRQGAMNLGQKCRCAMIVTNTGDSLVRNVKVEAAIPSGIDVVAAEPAPQQGTARWSIGDLHAGESRSIELDVIPRKRGNIALNAFVQFTGYSTSVFAVQEPMLKISVQGPDSVTVGEQVGYVVRVDNPGTGTANNVVIEAQMPTGMKHRSGRAPKIKVGTLNAGESRQVRLNLTATEGGSHQLTARASADGGLNDQAHTAVVVSKPSLDIAISGPENAAAGKPEDYTVTVTNTGNIPSINVRAKYKLPKTARFVRADRGGVHHESERVIDWFVGTLQPGDSAMYQVTLEAESEGEAIHLAGVVSEHTAVTTVTHSTSVQGIPQLFLDVAAAEPVPAIGEETTVRIIVQNEGSVDAEKVGLSCELPSGFEFVGAEGPSDFLAENGVLIFRSVDTITAGSEATYLIKGRCMREGIHRVRVRLGSPSLTEPVIGEGLVRSRAAR